MIVCKQGLSRVKNSPRREPHICRQQRRDVTAQAVQDAKYQIHRRQVTQGLLMTAVVAASVPPPSHAELESVPSTQPATVKTDSGILVQVVIEGTGPQPKTGDTVLIDYVLRRANGYFIYSTVEGVSFQPRDVPVGPVAFKLGSDSQWIPGVQELIRGMKQGGKVRAMIPPGGTTGYQNCDGEEPQPPTYATKRQLVNHCREPLLFEIALLRVTPSQA